MLSAEPRRRLGWLSRAVALLTTPFKFLGVSGWTDTGCSAEATGFPVRDAQHSTDGFWTIDVRLNDFRVGPGPADHGFSGTDIYRYIRIEVEPGTEAHSVCSRNPVAAGSLLSFGGPVLIDTDGPFLEIHPDRDFEIVRAQSWSGRG